MKHVPVMRAKMSSKSQFSINVELLQFMSPVARHKKDSSINATLFFSAKLIFWGMQHCIVNVLHLSAVVRVCTRPAEVWERGCRCKVHRYIHTCSIIEASLPRATPHSSSRVTTADPSFTTTL